MVPLPTPTDDTRQLAQAALRGLRHIFKPGFRYKKAGIMLLSLEPKAHRPRTLFDDPAAESCSARLMQVMDVINTRMGQDTLKLAANGIERPWKMRRVMQSPRFTTDWNEIPNVTA